MGVILYILLTGTPPFDGNTDAEILDNVSKLKYDLEVPEMKSANPLAKDLL
jgi:calcium-dependent protein kinase